MYNEIIIFLKARHWLVDFLSLLLTWIKGSGLQLAFKFQNQFSILKKGLQRTQNILEPD